MDLLGPAVIVVIAIAFTAWWLIDRRRARKLAARADAGQLTSAETDGASGRHDVDPGVTETSGMLSAAMLETLARRGQGH
ncbi:MAG TPA: hypothetical protein VMT43_05440 [Acidimicrobiales bacterium]|nr:hypothetical protein [Acidimicrobiales bacterium]